MATAKKITSGNHLPSEGDGRFPVYSKQFNDLVDVVNELEPSDGTLAADNINEATSGSGVTIDGVLIKDGTITTTAPMIRSVDPAITATGVDDTDGYALTEEINIITGGALDTGVELPTAQPGLKVVVANLTASNKKVYANASDQIDDKTATTGFVVVRPEQVITFVAYTAALWQSNFEAEGAYDQLYTDSIAENTADSGVRIDGVTVKDNTVKTGAGALTDNAVKINADNTGFYELTASQTAYANQGVVTALLTDEGVSSNSVQLRIAIGTPGTGVTAKHYGDSKNILTVLTFSGQAVDPPTAAAAEAHGHLLFTFPAGAHIHEVTYMSVELQGGGIVDADTPDVGIGSVIGSGANAVLSGVGATSEDYITGQTASDCNGTATVELSAAVAGYGQGISLNKAADVKAVYLNYADTWAGADTLDATGTVTLKWSIMS
jgi:hypothetical protein